MGDDAHQQDGMIGSQDGTSLFWPGGGTKENSVPGLGALPIWRYGGLGA